MMHHVHLCLEGLPQHAWNEHVAAKGRSLRHRVLVHLSIHEDFSNSTDDPDGLPPRPEVQPFDWEMAVVNDEAAWGSGAATGTSNFAATINRRDRRDDDHDDRRNDRRD